MANKKNTPTGSLLLSKERRLSLSQRYQNTLLLGGTGSGKNVNILLPSAYRDALITELKTDKESYDGGGMIFFDSFDDMASELFQLLKSESNSDKNVDKGDYRPNQFVLNSKSVTYVSPLDKNCPFINLLSGSEENVILSLLDLIQIVDDTNKEQASDWLREVNYQAANYLVKSVIKSDEELNFHTLFNFVADLKFRNKVLDEVGKQDKQLKLKTEDFFKEHSSGLVLLNNTLSLFCNYIPFERMFNKHAGQFELNLNSVINGNKVLFGGCNTDNKQIFLIYNRIILNLISEYIDYKGMYKNKAVSDRPTFIYIDQAEYALNSDFNISLVKARMCNTAVLLGMAVLELAQKHGFDVDQCKNDIILGTDLGSVKEVLQDKDAWIDTAINSENEDKLIGLRDMLLRTTDNNGREEYIVRMKDNIKVPLDKYDSALKSVKEYQKKYFDKDSRELAM